jgi:hypothetical protein
MLYNAPAKGDDGLYFVKALNSQKRTLRRLVTLTHLTLRLLKKTVKLGSESNFLRRSFKVRIPQV